MLNLDVGSVVTAQWLTGDVDLKTIPVRVEVAHVAHWGVRVTLMQHVSDVHPKGSQTILGWNAFSDGAQP